MKKIQARLPCLSFSHVLIIYYSHGQARQDSFLLQLSWNLHYQLEALGKQILTVAKLKNVTQKTPDRWGRKENYKGGQWTQLRSCIKGRPGNRPVSPSSQQTLTPANCFSALLAAGWQHLGFSHYSAMAQCLPVGPACLLCQSTLMSNMYTHPANSTLFTPSPRAVSNHLFNTCHLYRLFMCFEWVHGEHLLTQSVYSSVREIHRTRVMRMVGL